MRDYSLFYINREWVAPVNGGERWDVINPATEDVAGTILLGDEADVERAVAAARRAFDGYVAHAAGAAHRADRAPSAATTKRASTSWPPPSARRWARRWHKLARAAQAPMGLWQLQTALALAKDYPFEKRQGRTLHRQGAGRRVRADHAVELADEPDRSARWRRRCWPAAPSCSSRASWRRSRRRSSPRSCTAAGVPAGVFNLHPRRRRANRAAAVVASRWWTWCR